VKWDTLAAVCGWGSLFGATLARSIASDEARYPVEGDLVVRGVDHGLLRDEQLCRIIVRAHRLSPREVSENSNALWHHHLPTSATLAHEIGGGDRIFGYYEVGRVLLGTNPIFNTAGGLFIPLNENQIYVTGVFGPVRISKKTE